jgi:hypothetical protein
VGFGARELPITFPASAMDLLIGALEWEEKIGGGGVKGRKE